MQPPWAPSPPFSPQLPLTITNLAHKNTGMAADRERMVPNSISTTVPARIASLYRWLNDQAAYDGYDYAFWPSTPKVASSAAGFSSGATYGSPRAQAESCEEGNGMAGGSMGGEAGTGIEEKKEGWPLKRKEAPSATVSTDGSSAVPSFEKRRRTAWGGMGIGSGGGMENVIGGVAGEGVRLEWDEDQEW